MREFGNMLRVDLNRAVCSIGFVGTIFLMVLIEMFSSGQMLMRVSDYDVVEIIDNIFAGTGSADILLCIFPLIPYALSYAKDEEEQAVTFWMARVKARTFMASRYLAACISAFLVVFFSFCLLCCILYGMGHPFYHFRQAYGMAGYYQFLVDGQPMAYLLAYFIDRGLSAAMMAGCAIWISSWYPNRYLAFVGPVCIFFVSLRIVPRIYVGETYLTAGSWVEGTYDAAQGGIVSLLCKIGVVLMVCAIYGFFSTLHVKRRWHHA